MLGLASLSLEHSLKDLFILGTPPSILAIRSKHFSGNIGTELFRFQQFPVICVFCIPASELFLGKPSKTGRLNAVDQSSRHRAHTEYLSNIVNNLTGSFTHFCVSTLYCEQCDVPPDVLTCSKSLRLIRSCFIVVHFLLGTCLSDLNEIPDFCFFVPNRIQKLDSPT